MEYVHVLTDDSITVININTGEDVKILSDDSRFSAAVDHVRKGEYENVFSMDVKSVITTFFQTDYYGEVEVSIEDGEAYIKLLYLNDYKEKLHPAIFNKIMSLNSQGFKCTPLVNFLSNLYENPSKTAIDELFLFVESNNLPLTEDGHFIAYKIVKENYKDIYTGTMDNSVGTKVAIPRHLVDTDRNNTCSVGLHFCSKEYLSAYGSSSRDTDRCMLVKINPADVVSIPSDYNNAKGRTWIYEVVGEIPAGWRNTLASKDFTDSAVVDSNGEELDIDEDEELDEDNFGDGFFESGYKDGWESYLQGEDIDLEEYVQDDDYTRGFYAGYKDKKNHRKNKFRN